MLHSLPEELSDKILALAVAPTPDRPAWHSSSRLSILLTCKSFHRIALRHYYHSIHLYSQDQSLSLLQILQSHPEYSTWIKSLSLDSIFDSLDQLLSLCPQVTTLDISLDSCVSDVVPFCTSLSTLTQLSSLTIRKPVSVYLTQPRVRSVLSAMADCASNGTWNGLREVHMPFKVSSDDALASPVGLGGMLFPALPANASPTSPTSPMSPGPITLFSQALSTLPNLSTFSTQLPTVWNEVLLTVSKNERLEKIILGSAPTPVRTPSGARRMSSGAIFDVPAPTRGAGVVFSGLYMSEAKKHPRLVELIKAGTPILRNRAQTMAMGRPGLGPSASMPSIPIGAAPSSSSSSSSCSPSTSGSDTCGPTAAAATTDKRSMHVQGQGQAGPSSTASTSSSSSSIPSSWRRRSLAV